MGYWVIQLLRARPNNAIVLSQLPQFSSVAYQRYVTNYDSF